jgi:hypothetical protein
MSSIPVGNLLETKPIPGQIGYAVLDLNGSIVSIPGRSSDNSNNCTQQEANIIPNHDIQILYQMLLECGSILSSSSSAASSSSSSAVLFRRFTVNLPSMRYIVSMDSTFIYIAMATATTTGCEKRMI